MFFRSKRENGKDSSQPVPPTPGKALTTAPATRAAKPLAPEELKQRAETSQRLAAMLGGIVGLMLRSPRHRDRKLSDLRWLVLPAIRTGQLAVVSAQSKAHGYSAPIASVLWASVSAEVDKRLSENLDAPMRLGPREWKSGDILWLVEAIGDERAVSALVQRLHAKDWKGRCAKARVKDAKGQVKIRLFEAQAASNGAAANRK
jgi:hemolysin-activating ACP:hemolysin acyltransferase